jgi:gliding motility-associated-like protein
MVLFVMITRENEPNQHYSTADMSFLRILLISMFALLLWQPLKGQVAIDQTMTPEELVQEVLLGQGITAWNITFNGQPGNTLNNQIGRYIGPSAFVDFDDGIVMASGDVIQLTGGFGAPAFNVTGDPDLAVIASPFSVNNCAILEFDFIPTGDSLEIRFVFMSQEYPGFTCSSYNDPFGFFISGPGITGPFTSMATNIALIPNSNTPIGVNSINGGVPTGGGQVQNCLDVNPNFVEDSQYFVNNNPEIPDDIQFPGLTVTITAYAEVICGEEYHIKLGIADASDTALDSGVIIEAASFQSNLFIDADLTIPVGVNDSTLYDGCGLAYLTFTRPGDTSLVETVYLEYSGDAINGVHYPELPDSLVFEAGVESITFELSVPPGVDITGPLQAIITITNIASECSGDVLTNEFDFWVNTVEPLDAIFNDVDIEACGDSVTIGPVPIDGYGLYTFDWSDGFTGPEQTLAPLETVTYTITVGDTCGMEPVTGDITINVPVAPPVFVDAGEDQSIESCFELANLFGEISGGDENYSFEWYNDGDLISEEQSFQYPPPGTSTLTFVGTDACGNTDSDEMTIFVPPVEVFIDAGPDQILETCFDSVFVETAVSGGVEPPPGEWTVTVQSASWGDATTWNIQDANGLTVASGGPYGNGYLDTQTFSNVAEPLTFNITSTLGDNIPNFTISCNGEVLSGNIPGNSSQSFPGLECFFSNVEFTYEWSLPNGVIIGEEESIWFSSLTETYLYVTVFDACNNAATDSIFVSIQENPLFVDAGEPLVLEHCFDSVLVEATVTGGVPGDVTYNWWAATTGGLGSGTDNTLWFNTPIESYIVVEATDFCGNQAIDSTLVTVAELEVIADAGEDQIVNSCLTFVDLLGTGSGGYGDYSYVWTQHDTLILANDAALNINPSDGSIYTITITDECGNSGSDEVAVFYDIPELTIEMSPDTLVCNGGIAFIWAQPEGGVPPYSYDWSSTTFNGPEITVQTNETQNYTVMVTDQCDGFILGETNVVVSHVNAVFDTFYEDVYTVSTLNRSTPGDYLWEFGDGFSTSETHPVHTYLNLEEYTITLVVTDSLGCQDSFTAEVVPEGDLYIPNAFTPNEDGVNDLFEVKGFNIESFKMVIVNRYGQEVFSANTLEEKWNGADINGDYYVQNEVYVYTVEAVTTRGTLIERRGTITVLR